MTAGRRMAVLKLDFSPVLPSEKAHGNNGKARVCLALREKVNHGERVIRLQPDRKGGNIISVHIFIDFSPVFLYFFFSVSFCSLISLHSLSGVAETKPHEACCFPPLLLHLLPSPPAHKRWRLMNSALMRASANCIGIGNSSQYYKMFSPSRWPPAGPLVSVTLRKLPSFCLLK